MISDIRPTVSPGRVKVASKPKLLATHRTAPAVPSRQERSRVLRRELVAPRQYKHRRTINIRSLALASLAAILFVFGAGVGITQLRTNQQVKAQVKTLAAHTTANSDQSGDSSIPSETPGTGNYHPGPLQPRKLTISSIGIDAPIVKLGIKANGELKTPSNIFDVGWYEGSAQPGELGAVLLDGHVHGPTKPGVFVNLKKLKPGDKISLQRGDGKVFTYHVVTSKSYPKDNVDMGAAFNSATPGKPGLNLITCDGSFDKSGEYSNRLIVFAVQD